MTTTPSLAPLPAWRGSRALLRGAALALAFMSPASLAAQTAGVHYACYVPSSGTVYRIKAPGLRQQCGTSTRDGKLEPHVEFSWPSAAAATVETSGAASARKGVDHGSLDGLGDDDHPQYLPVDGFRTATSGFAVRGTLGMPTPLPDGSASGSPEPALLWHAGKGAFRVGGIGDPNNIDVRDWNESDIGPFSIGLGTNTYATGPHAVAAGLRSRATGDGAVAVGMGAQSSGPNSVAVGTGLAMATRAISIHGVSSGWASISIGDGANTNGHAGAIVVSPSIVGQGHLFAVAENQFAARASSFWFGNNAIVTATPGRLIETSTGAYLTTGGAWTNSSDSARKHRFRDVDVEEVLGKVAAMPIRTWSYRDDSVAVRHLGPTAQDFHAAFGLGDSEKAIATVDADGVSLAAIQALEQRTAAQARHIATLSEENAALAARLDAVVRELETLGHHVERGPTPPARR